MSWSMQVVSQHWLEYVSAYALAEDQLSEEPRHRSDIIEAVQAIKPYPASTVSSALSELVRDGTATRTSPGWYALDPELLARLRRASEADPAAGSNESST